MKWDLTLKDNMRLPALPHRILISLLYGRHRFLTRHPSGAITVPIAPLAGSVRSRSDRVKEAFHKLDEMGLLDQFQWHGHYAIVRPKAPLGYMWTMPGEVIDIDGATVVRIDG